MSSAPSFLLDENLPSKLAKQFMKDGYQATSVALVGLVGQHDRVIFKYACSHALTIITTDNDFLRVTDFPPPHSGIVLVRYMPRSRIATIIAEILAALPTIASLDLPNHVYILEHGQMTQYA
jgi:predicted nuclease of predicted toxin-antitoxin system